MSSRFQFAFLIMLLIVLVGSSKGCTAVSSCTADDGSTVDVTTPFGMWKKVAGYSSARTEAELELNFDLLVVEPGDRICMFRVTNGSAQTTTVFQGTYTNDSTLKKLVITYQDESLGTDTATYTLPGGCSDPGLVMSYTDGTSETFELRTKESSQVTCTVSGAN